MDKPQIDLRIDESSEAHLLLELLQREINENTFMDNKGELSTERIPTPTAYLLRKLLMAEIAKNTKVIMIFSGGDYQDLSHYFGEEGELPF